MKVSVRVRELYRCDMHKNPLIWRDHCCKLQSKIVELRFGRYAAADYVHRGGVHSEINLTYRELITLECIKGVRPL